MGVEKAESIVSGQDRVTAAHVERNRPEPPDRQ